MSKSPRPLRSSYILVVEQITMPGVPEAMVRIHNLSVVIPNLGEGGFGFSHAPPRLEQRDPAARNGRDEGIFIVHTSTSWDWDI